MTSYYGPQAPNPRYYSRSIQQTIQLNAALNGEAQAAIDAKEPSFNIWEIDQLDASMSNLSMASSGQVDGKKRPVEKPSAEKRQSVAGPSSNSTGQATKPSKFAGFKKALAMKSPEEKAAARTDKLSVRGRELRNAILQEEDGRWPDPEWRQIVANYQEKVGMTRKIADLRVRHPTQYLHLLRAGYFEPIPVAWANLASNPLKFSIEAASGWRGITPAWRGYEDTAEERLYWVLNHREGSVGVRMKPDLISAMNMARARMASAVEPPPAYFSPNDTCHLQHTSEGYSKQVMPPPFRAFDAPEVATDDTMILLDVSGSMDFDPLRPNYNEYLITGYSRSTQPKNKGMSTPLNRFTSADVFCYRRRQGHHPPLHRRNGQSRPQLSRLPAHHFRESSQLHWRHQPSKSRFNVEKRQTRWWNTSDDRLAESQRSPFPETFRIGNPPPGVWLASWSANSHAETTSSPRWRSNRHGRIRARPPRPFLGTRHNLLDWCRWMPASPSPCQ
jgi:hypothetical protein